MQISAVANHDQCLNGAGGDSDALKRRFSKEIGKESTARRTARSLYSHLLWSRSGRLWLWIVEQVSRETMPP